jgi:hypothetical protein
MMNKLLVVSAIAIGLIPASCGGDGNGDSRGEIAATRRLRSVLRQDAETALVERRACIASQE